MVSDEKSAVNLSENFCLHTKSFVSYIFQGSLSFDSLTKMCLGVDL